MIGEEGVTPYNTFDLTTQEQTSLTYNINFFDDHCSPKKDVVFETDKFFKRDQFVNEKFDSFLTDMNKLSQNDDLSLQERLLRISDLNLKTPIDYCRTAEVSKIEVKNLQENTIEIEEIRNKRIVRNKQVGKGNSSTNFKCRRCSRVHGPRQCPAYGKKCKKCGAKSCKKFNLIQIVRSLSNNDDRQKFIKDNIDLFEGLGSFSGVCKIKIESGCKPIANPPRRISITIKEILNDTLLNLEKRSIITKVDNPRGWINNLVIVEKKGKTLRWLD
ncbi:hypothetical protein QE152_g24881 [Popillia japonica]|uniref:Uncharacterized protein n=1 Tax=Popillia japonica TaxID=7064 RepID=A0AAW1K483_POPJA